MLIDKAHAIESSINDSSEAVMSAAKDSDQGDGLIKVSLITINHCETH